MMDPIEVLATVAVFGVVVKAVVQAIRRQWPGLDGLAVQAVAVALGAGGAWAFDLRATAALLEAAGAQVGRMPVPAVDYLITGVAIAAAAGVVAELARPAAVEIQTEVVETVEVDGPIGAHEVIVPGHE
jgi:hypothetical protein